MDTDGFYQLVNEMAPLRRVRARGLQQLPRDVLDL